MKKIIDYGGIKRGNGDGARSVSTREIKIDKHINIIQARWKQ